MIPIAYLIFQWHINEANTKSPTKMGSLPPTIPSENKEALFNPKKEIWNHQDSLIVSWLLASISEQILPELVGCETSHSSWSRVLNNYASQSQTKILTYKKMVQSQKKGTMSMKEYLALMKSYVVSLAMMGHPVNEDEQLMGITEGLSP
ncbi:hypothetical protein LWI28_015240 [Acer negundo]|uniref:Uncharacterized protein n=1 Tax=Acer negundo TaxID=4023 RepID=A0AAD5NT72_ACENE|nr:hypothetical protein LWI28_015240 [Acer negundo]